MRAQGVVVLAPALDDDPRLGEAVEQLPVQQLVVVCPLESSLIAFVKLVTGVCSHAGFMVLSAVGLDGPPHVGVRCSDRPKWSSWLPMAPHFQGRPDPRQTSRRGRIC